MGKIYEYRFGSHRFNSNGKYLGWFDADGKPASAGAPFDTWTEWDEEKHKWLTETLLFTYRTA